MSTSEKLVRCAPLVPPIMMAYPPRSLARPRASRAVRSCGSARAAAVWAPTRSRAGGCCVGLIKRGPWRDDGVVDDQLLLPGGQVGDVGVLGQVAGGPGGGLH